jgi:hypothetical protein
MMPETWLPTWTVVTAERVPVAFTLAETVPWLTASVRYLSPPWSLPRRKKKSPTRTPTTTTMAMTRNLRCL